MDKGKIVILCALLIVFLIFLYVANLILPIWDDVWRSLVAGLAVGAVAGFWGGIKWKDLEYKNRKD